MKRKKTKAILPLFILTCIVIWNCSQFKNPIDTAIENQVTSKTMGIPSGGFSFDLTSPTDLQIASSQDVTVDWSEPFPYCYDFIRYEILMDGSNAASQNNISHSYCTFNNLSIGWHEWDVRVIYGVEGEWEHSKYSSNGSWKFWIKIADEIAGPTVAYPRNNQTWSIETSGSPVAYSWTVTNMLGQTVCTTTNSQLSINQIPVGAYQQYTVRLNVTVAGSSYTRYKDIYVQ